MTETAQDQPADNRQDEHEANVIDEIKRYREIMQKVWPAGTFGQNLTHAIQLFNGAEDRRQREHHAQALNEAIDRIDSRLQEFNTFGLNVNAKPS